MAGIRVVPRIDLRPFLGRSFFMAGTQQMENPEDGILYM